jgi:hypothetical protein
MVTNLEIVDTAVKIGLGAIISGFFGFLLARISYRNDLGKEFAKRRRDSLEKVSSQFIATHNRVRDSLQLIDRYSGYLGDDKEKEATRDKAEQNIRSAPAEMADIESMLWLLGEAQAAKVLEKYIVTLYASGREDVGGVDHAPPVYQRLDDLEKVKHEFFDALSAAYRRNE